MGFAFVNPDVITAVAMLVLLVGVPLFVVAVIAVASAYLQYDAERYLEDLEADDGTFDPDE
ncbi:hypothetical protein RBH26_03665 [Natronolimnohabitans sp. A-GB9]|uniref:hypothetical protein n=1 Tax=Natronolimnohabitans sp. A-GB9 TaxID=3069757 RepID=UPI0027B7EAC4|nr:hypothetical protein [Natronolimnohabitans sp. A-GB9]MDQ2049573.1 hypothetical protein [Natronolimnohabitans sp. A-GB9]